ncbi:MAG: hypothetical protein M1837_001280 [Sclerophora amabilis]|nr:MAG: hypothetical protein M1837_001280 [Sclerophora amabilis]
MRLLKLGSLLVSAAAVKAFKDTSPFFLFSSVELPEESQQTPQLTSSSSLLQSIKQQLSSCSADSYLIISQPGVNSADFASASTSPTLHRHLDTKNADVETRSSYSVSEVVGDLDVAELQRYLGEHCDAEVTKLDGTTGHFEMAIDTHRKVMRFDYPTLPTSKPDRIRQLQHIDTFLSSVIDLLPHQSKYTVMYTTSSSPTTETHMYQNIASNDKQEIIQAELKRRAALDSKTLQPRKEGNTTLVDGPLFERYQFLTPGLFMGILTALVLLSILSVGINGVSSLQVSYAAFDKEMGPSAQKKQ